MNKFGVRCWGGWRSSDWRARERAGGARDAVGRDGGGNPGPGPGPYVEDAGNDYRPYDPSSSPRFDRASPRRVPRGMSFEEEGEEEARPGYHREIDPIDESRYL